MVYRSTSTVSSAIQKFSSIRSPSTAPQYSHDYHLTTENVNEALFLLVSASLGLTLNAFVVGCILTTRRLRRMTNAFVVHGCVLDAVKCVYCVPFATSLLKDVAPGFCPALGGSYVVIVTASGFNIVAMICCEAYAFSEHNVGLEGRGSLCCAVFGVLMVYIGSVIIHLGPTIIGGDFNYNDLIGNCIFVYGPIKSYVVHTMWIVIMTIAMIGAIYYLAYFYRHIRANSTHRLATLVRASVAISRGNVTTNADCIRDVVQRTIGRSRALMLITVLFILCWYPLYCLTLIDPKFQQPTKVYKLLTFIAWSNAALNPLVLLLFDTNIDTFRRICCRFSAAETRRRRRRQSSVARQRSFSDEARLSLASGSLPRSSAGAAGQGGGRTVIPEVLSTPDSVYLRVGCRLCSEGQPLGHAAMQCNGGAEGGQGTRMRDLSFCDLHSLVE